MVFTQNKYLKVFICLLLCVTILSFSMFGEVEDAHALVLTSTVIAGLAVMLTAVGVTFATRTQLNDTCSNYLNWRGSSSLTRSQRESTAIQLATDGALELTLDVVNDLKQFIQTMSFNSDDSTINCNRVISGFNLAEGDLSPTTVANISLVNSSNSYFSDLGIIIGYMFGRPSYLNLVAEGSSYHLYLTSSYNGGACYYYDIGTFIGTIPFKGTVSYAYSSTYNTWLPLFDFENLTLNSSLVSYAYPIVSSNPSITQANCGTVYRGTSLITGNASISDSAFSVRFNDDWSSSGTYKGNVFTSIANASVSGSNTIAVSVPYNGDYAPDSGEDDETTTGETIYIPTGLIVDGAIADSIPNSLTPTGVRENPNGGGSSGGDDEDSGNTTIIGLLRNILSALGGFVDSILSSLPTILALISGYTLFQNLFTHFLPTQVATILWAFWLTTMAIWLFRMIADR